MINNPAKYLDNILKYLSEDFNRTYTIQEVQNMITPMKLLGEDKIVKFSPDLLVDLYLAVEYLSSINLVNYYRPHGEVKITFEGYLKFKNNSFTKEIRTKSINQTLQRLAWTIPIIISIIALYYATNKTPLPLTKETLKDNKTVTTSNITTK